jgi:hypothetical protein
MVTKPSYSKSALIPEKYHKNIKKTPKTLLKAVFSAFFGLGGFFS